MSTPTAPQVACEQQHPSLAVSDVTAAAEFYTRKLGFRLAFTWGDPPTMAGVNLGEAQLFIEEGTPAPQGCSVYFVIDDADELFDFTFFLSVLQLVPIVPYRILELGGNEVAAGMILGILTYASAVSAPITGSLADRFGKQGAI